MSEWNVEFKPIPKTQEESFKKLFTGYDEGLVRSEPGGFVMAPPYGRNAEKIYNIQPRKDDVWLLTFPKCGNCKMVKYQWLPADTWLKTGTTWTAELLWLLKNNCDLEAAAKKTLGSRTSFIEYVNLISNFEPN